MKFISVPLTGDTRLTLVDDNGEGWVFCSWYRMSPGVLSDTPSMQDRQRRFTEPKMAVEFFLRNYGDKLESWH